MRRLLVLALTVLACCALAMLAACGASSDSPEAQDSTAEVVDGGAGSAADASAGLASEEYGNLISFTALTLDGEEVTEDIFAQADVTLINFWATYCGPCLREMPDLAEFAEQLPGNVQFVTACLDVGAVGVEPVEEILADAGYEGITITGGGGDFEQLIQHIQYIPTTIAFDSEGRALGSALVGSPEDVAGAYGMIVDDALALTGSQGAGA